MSESADREETAAPAAPDAQSTHATNSLPSLASLRACFLATYGFVGFCIGYFASALFKIPRPIYAPADHRWLFIRGSGGYYPIITWFGMWFWGLVGGAVAAALTEIWVRTRRTPPGPRAYLRCTLLVLAALVIDLVYCACLVWSELR